MWPSSISTNFVVYLSDKENDFKKIDGTNDLGVPYDLNSLMHFGPTTLAKTPGLNTIEKLDGSTDFGQATGLSDSDVQQARLLLCPGTSGKYKGLLCINNVLMANSRE